MIETCSSCGGPMPADHFFFYFHLKGQKFCANTCAYRALHKDRADQLAAQTEKKP